MDISGLVDERNRKLWETLNSEYDISIVREARETYCVRTKNKLATIYIPTDHVDSASFTHELLHIYLESKGVYVGPHFRILVISNPELAKFISDSLTEQVGNCLEHIKMLPQFIQMGYNREDFIYDYAIDKLNKHEIKELKNSFKKRTLIGSIGYNSKAIDLFIGKYFAVKACPNLTVNYDKGLAELKNLDEDLYNILDEFMNGWTIYDYNEPESLNGGYSDILLDLTTNLQKWSMDKSIV